VVAGGSMRALAKWAGCSYTPEPLELMTIESLAENKRARLRMSAIGRHFNDMRAVIGRLAVS
jgi:hypothetical protein